ncbi:MAG TPA: AraC family transcriptional regulator ligand-binding domain-containing protein [bacterium]|nr:AraC family transcriptional regulator ligand-binding domain-containing protein [bacterium]
MDLPAYGLFADLLFGGVSLGMDGQALLNDLGWQGGAGRLYRSWVPEAKISDLWQALMERSSSDAVALRLGERPLARLHTINALMLSTHDPRKAVERMVAHWHLLYPESQWTVEVTALSIDLVYENRRTAPDTHLDAEYRLATLATLVRWITQPRIEPQLVTFRAPRPAYGGEFYRVFRCPVMFDAPADLLRYKRGLRQQVVPLHDPWLGKALLETVGGTARGLPPDEDLPDVLRNALRGYVSVGDTGIKTVAPQLGLSAAELRRALRRNGTTYRELLEDVRKQVCLELLAIEKKTMDEIAEQLGYSNTPNFYRACKRWFRSTPTELRARLDTAGAD